MKFFDASRYASPLRKALDKKENAPRNLRFETLENRALLSVTPLDNLETIAASAEIAPAQTVETPVVDLSALAVSNATTETNVLTETEPNDSYAAAQDLGTLTQKTTVEGIAEGRPTGSGYQNDWYKIKLTGLEAEGSYIRLSTDSDAKLGPVQLYLKTTTGGTLSNPPQAVFDSATNTKTLSLENIAPGEYCIQIYNSTAQDISYNLTIDPPKPETDDVYEENDAFATATDLGMVGSLSIDAKAGPDRNVDYYKFTLVDEGTATDYVNVNYTKASNVQLNVKIYNEAGDVVFSNVNTWASNKIENFSLEGQKAGDYYVEIVANQNVETFSRYTLSIEAPQTAPAAPTGFAATGDKTETETGTLFLANEARLSWNPVEYATGYEVRYSADGGATWTTQTLGADVTSVDLAELDYATQYVCQVRALRVDDGSDGFSVWNVASEWEDSALTFATVAAPVAPELAQPELTHETFKPSEQKITLTWTNVAYERGYVVQTLGADGETWEAVATLDADTTTWTTDKLDLGAEYSYRVVAYNNAGETVSAEIVVATPDVPAAPTGLTVEHEASENPTAILTWNAATETGVEAVVSYTVTVYEKTVDAETGEATFVARAPQTASTATYTVENLLPSGVYYFEIVANNAYGASEALTSDEFTVGALINETVQNLNVKLVAAPKPYATVVWDQLANALSYDVVVVDAAGQTVYQIDAYQLADGEVLTLPATVDPDDADSEARFNLGETYVCKVYARNAYGASEIAAEKEFTFGDVPEESSALTATVNASTAPTATLTWADLATETGYRVEIQTENADGETVWETVAELEADAIEWTTGTLELGATYQYRVVAVNAYGETASNGVKVVVGNVPAQPTANYEFNHYAKNVILTWDAVEGADAYVVEQLGADGEWSPVAPPTGNPETTETTWESGAFDFGTSHAFRVVAKNAYGSSVASDAVSFTIQDEPTVVTSLEDGDLNLLDGVTTLREALRFAQDGDEIVFAEDLRGGTITLTGGPLSIMEKEISVRGFVDETGAPELTIDGDHKDMIFVVANTRASFFGLSVVNGYASYAKYGGGALGGGFSVDNANATFANVDVIGCRADVYGGGIYIASNVEAPGQGKSTLTNVRILDNVADNGESSGLGGGLYATGGFMGGEIEMMNVEISGNQARADGGGVFLNDITSTLTNVKITDNIAQGNGGAFYANAPDHTFISNLTGYPLLLISTKLTNVEITGNQAYKGFGFYAEEFDVEELSLRNVTLADNVGTQEGASGDVYLANGAATFYNSIVDGDVQGEEYAANAYNALSSFTGWANADEEGVVNYVLNEGDSVFADGSYALGADSVALNKGDNAYVPETLTTDLAGNNRFNGAVDLGAYENQAPLAPTDLKAEFNSATHKTTLTWTDNAINESGYEVRQLGADDEWATVATLAANATTWQSAAFHVDGKYVYRVVAVNAYGQTESDSVEVEALGTVPAAPSKLTFGAYDVETGKLEMSWSDVESETRYRVEASLDGENWWFSQNLDADVTERVATLSYKNTPYFFRVRAENAAGVSEWTTAKFTPPPTQPGAIKFTAYDATTRKLDMSWGNSLNETKYRVEASLDGENWWFSQSLDADVTERVAKLSYTDRTYFFRVRAENATGVSEWTVAQFNPQPSAPQALEFGAYDHRTGELEMNWTNVEGETRYRVEASYNGENWWFSQNTSTDVINRVAKLGYTDREYFFRVRAENLAGVSEWTTAKFTPPVLTTPEAPTSLVFDSYDATTGALVMSWTGVTKQATQLRVEFTYDGGATWTHSQTLSGIETGRTAKIGWPSKTYQFRICAINVQGRSEWTYSELFNANEWNAADPISAAFADLFADDDDEFWFEL